ncbi:MAG: tetratricopeptide repeat protein [Chitinophagaceae bacterium]|nr:tetratricopeptide repeat protein [Chitinophagaceae bacterium]
MKPIPFITRCVCLALLLLSFTDVYSQKVTDLIAAGDKLYTAKKYREAIDQYTKALKLDPQSGEAGRSGFGRVRFHQCDKT